MNNNDLIYDLGALVGVITRFRNYRNEARDISPASLAAILEARGYKTDSAEALRRQIAQFGMQRGEFRLPPVIVLREHERLQIAIELPVAMLETELGWRLSLEDGRVTRGKTRPVRTDDATEGPAVTCVLDLAGPAPAGYHWLTISVDADARHDQRIRLIIAPTAAYDGDEAAVNEWGVCVQLYGLKSARNWGIGDFTDLARLADGLGRAGAGFVGINPLHALYPSNPEHASPYSPASRAFINYLYIDVEAVPEFRHSQEAREKVRSEYFQGRLASLRSSTHVDYSGVAFLKLVILRHLHDAFVRNELSQDSERARQYHVFCEEGGAALEQLCVFYALYAHHRKASRQGGWRSWPAALHDPNSEAVARFAEDNQQTVGFYMYLQWLADEQLASAQATARAAGMPTGLYRDLAVGIDRDGADNWRNQQLYCVGASVGAPPDPLAPQGQDWGLPPMDPLRMQEEGYATFADDLRDNMRHCGALRVDHVMQLMRLWWTPAGQASSEGAYVKYPVDDLLGIIALESHRNRCRIIGEDLGVVPDEIRKAMQENHIWSYKVALFEKDGAGHFTAPKDYAENAMATLTTHDLPTLPGYWRGADLLLREKLALFPSFEVKEQSWQERILDRQGMVAALKLEQLYPEGLPDEANDIDPLPEELLLALETFLARSASRMVCAQLEDWLGIEDPVNVPGTSDQYPNWRRRLTQDLEDILEGPLLAKHAAALKRPRQGTLANDEHMVNNETGKTG